MGGQGSGPVPKPFTIIKKVLKKDSKNLPKYFEKLSELALKGDRDTLQYLIDRHMGKPKQQTELEVPGLELLGANTLVKLWELVEQRRIERSQDALQITGSTEGSQQDSQSEVSQ